MDRSDILEQLLAFIRPHVCYCVEDHCLELNLDKVGAELKLFFEQWCKEADEDTVRNWPWEVKHQFGPFSRTYPVEYTGALMYFNFELCDDRRQLADWPNIGYDDFKLVDRRQHGTP